MSSVGTAGDRLRCDQGTNSIGAPGEVLHVILKKCQSELTGTYRSVHGVLVVRNQL